MPIGREISSGPQISGLVRRRLDAGCSRFKVRRIGVSGERGCPLRRQIAAGDARRLATPPYAGCHRAAARGLWCPRGPISGDLPGWGVRHVGSRAPIEAESDRWPISVWFSSALDRSARFGAAAGPRGRLRIPSLCRSGRFNGGSTSIWPGPRCFSPHFPRIEQGRSRSRSSEAKGLDDGSPVARFPFYLRRVARHRRSVQSIKKGGFGSVSFEQPLRWWQLRRTGSLLGDVSIGTVLGPQ